MPPAAVISSFVGRPGGHRGRRGAAGAARVADPAGRGDAGRGHPGPAADQDHRRPAAVVAAVGAAAAGARACPATPATTRCGLILGGVLVAFIGVALLTPLISRPVVSAARPALLLVGAGQAGPAQLRPQPAPHGDHRGRADGRHRAGHRRHRDPGLGQEQPVRRRPRTPSRRELIISGRARPARGRRRFDPAVLDQAAALPGRTGGGRRLRATRPRSTASARTSPRPTTWRALRRHLRRDAGDRHASAALGPDQIVVSTETATERHLAVGTRLDVQLSRGDAAHATRSRASTPSDDLPGGFLLPAAATHGLRRTAAVASAFVRLADGTAGRRRCCRRSRRCSRTARRCRSADRSAFIEQQTSELRHDPHDDPDPAGAGDPDRGARHHQHARAVGAGTHPRAGPAAGDRPGPGADHADGHRRGGGDLGLRRAARRGRRRRPGRRGGPGAARRGHHRAGPAVGADGRSTWCWPPWSA